MTKRYCICTERVLLLEQVKKRTQHKVINHRLASLNASSPPKTNTQKGKIMYTKYYSKSAEYNTQYNQIKRVLIKRLIQVGKIVGYSVSVGLVYLVLVAATV